MAVDTDLRTTDVLGALRHAVPADRPPPCWPCTTRSKAALDPHGILNPGRVI